MPGIEMAPPTYFGNLPQIQPPQSENLLATAQQMEQLQTARQLSPYQVAAAQASVQGQQLQNQQAQMEIASQQGLMKAYMASGGDPDKMATIAPQYNVLPKDIMAVRTNLLNMAKTRAETNKATLDATDAKNDLLNAAYQPAFAETDPTKQAALVAQINQGLLARYPNFQQSDLINYTGPDSLTQAKAAYTTHQWVAAQGEIIRGQAAATQANTAATRESNEGPGQTAASDQAQRTNVAAKLGSVQDPASYDQIRDDYIAKGGNQAVFPPSRMAFDQTGKMIPAQQAAINRAGMTPEQRTQADQAALPKTEPELALIINDATKPQAQRDAARAALGTLTAAKIAARPVTNITVPGLGGPNGAPNAAASTLSGQPYLDSLPQGTAAQIKAIAEGRAVMPSGSARSQAAIQLRNAVFQYDPDYSDQRAQIRRAFTSGTDGRNIGALNTAAVHLDQFADAATAMSSGTFTPANAAWHALQSSFGATAPTNFAALKTAVAGEMASALKGNATDPEIANVSKAIDAANSPAQLQGVVETNLHVLGAKLNTYQERYQQQIPGDKVWSPVLPSARGVFQKHGFDPTAGAPPGGAVKYTQTATGPNGHKIGSNDGKAVTDPTKTWFDVQTGAKVQ